MKLFKVTVLDIPKGAISAAGTYENKWVVSDDIKDVAELFPNAETITVITNNLIFNGKEATT